MDRRVLSAILLMMLIAILPAVIFKRPPPAVPADSVATSAPVPSAAGAVDTPGPAPVEAAPPADRPATAAVPAPAAPPRVVRVTSPLYTYGFSTRGARLVEATLHRYRSMAPGDPGGTAQIMRPGSDFLGLRLVVGADTVSLRDWEFEPSADSLDAASGTPLTLTAARGAVTVSLTLRFDPDTYQVPVEGLITGIGANGGTLLIGMGPGLRNTESDSLENLTQLGIVTKAADTENTKFDKLKPVPTDLSGPFAWVAVKSKYFVAAVFAVDTLETSSVGRLAGVRARATEEGKVVTAAQVLASMPVPAAGGFGFLVYAGPMEYPRLREMGHDFYDVNPYGWPGFRTVIRPVAVAARWLLVWMHEQLGLAYGMALILFGILVRVALWPLNQKAMRASMAMQAVQPLMKDLQERHKNDPQKLQQEMFKLYKEHKVNPFGGCWPMLLPMPVLFALFFVFLNTIELRGAPFLWLNDLSRPDPLYVIPAVMGLSMYLVSKVGQMGMTPNPQMKMMLYLMPVMMTVLFLNFASGLNLYYAVQNLASVPQQWMLAKERMKMNPTPAPAAEPPAAKGKKKKG